MKKIFIFTKSLLFSFCFIEKISAQSVRTPKGREVYCIQHTLDYTEPEMVAQRNLDLDEIQDNQLNAIIEGNPSKLYNCHFYALHISDNPGATLKYEMEQSEIYKYLEDINNYTGDGSFKLSDTAHADKIIQGNISTYPYGTLHSMAWSPDLNNSNSGRNWVSKCSENSLVRHSKTQCPYYASSDLTIYHHYARTTKIDWKNPYIYIPEPRLICNRNSNTFNIIVDPHFYIVSGNISDPSKFDNFAVNDTNKTVTIDPKSNSLGEYEVSVIIRNGAGVDTTITKKFNLGSDPHIPYNTLQGPFCMCAWESYYIYTINTGGYNFSWQFMYGSIQDMYKGSINVTPYMDGGYLTLTTTNECYPTEPTLSSYTGSISYPACGYCPDYYRVYPNPASEVVYIEYTEKALERVEKAKIVMENLPPKEAANINLPDLEDYKFTLLNKLGEVKMIGKAQNGKVTLNISHLPPGAYFIVIDTGIKPETHELIIN